MSGDFERRFRNIINNAVPALVRKGMTLAGMRLLEDAIMESPTVPIDEGTLRGSGSVFVGNAHVGDSQNVGGNPTPSHDFADEGEDHHQITATVGFNTPYAARLHEHPEFEFTNSDSGGKFLESKMTRNRDRYMRIVADTVKAGAGP